MSKECDLKWPEKVETDRGWGRVPDQVEERKIVVSRRPTPWDPAGIVSVPSAESGYHTPVESRVRKNPAHAVARKCFGRADIITVCGRKNVTRMMSR